MKIGDCLSVTPSDPLNLWQKAGLSLVSRLQKGRDVVLAIDLTGSVDFNDEGRTRLRQIVQDSLQPQDKVYVVLFASEINSLSSKNHSLPDPIYFQGNKQDIDTILKAIPAESNPNIQNTDIHRTELFVYQGLAQLNQCRLTENRPIKYQSVVWITDAPLLTETGISSKTWTETPANSPFRQKNSAESKERESWIKALPLDQRSQLITTTNNNTYQLSVIDIPPTVQEFCTPAPGGEQTCLINGYLWQQLWIPVLITILGMTSVITAVVWGIKYWLALRTPWILEITETSDEDEEKQKIKLKTSQKVAIGGDGLKTINCPGEETRGYLERKGNRLYLKPTNYAPLYTQGTKITTKIPINQSLLKINCPNQLKEDQDFELIIHIVKS